MQWLHLCTHRYKHTHSVSYTCLKITNCCLHNTIFLSDLINMHIAWWVTYLQLSEWYDIGPIPWSVPDRCSSVSIVVVVLFIGLIIELPPLVVTHWLPARVRQASLSNSTEPSITGNAHTYTLTPSGGDVRISPVTGLANIFSRVWGSIISTHSSLCTERGREREEREMVNMQTLDICFWRQCNQCT